MSEGTHSEAFAQGLALVEEALLSRRNAAASPKAPSAALRVLLEARGSSQKNPASSPAAKMADSPIVSQPQGAQGVVGEKPQSASGPSTRSLGGLPPPPSQKEPLKSLLPAFPLENAGAGDRAARLDALKASVRACASCQNLVESRRQVVFGEGSPSAELMLVGEAPGPEEDLEGRPFAGESGELLDKMLQAMGVSREDVYFTSALKCRPTALGDPSESRAPERLEMDRCLPHLSAQIGIVRPKVIVAFGAGAMHALFGGNAAMGKLRSQWHDLHGIPVMPTYHPKYLIRNSGMAEKRKVWEDLLQVMARLNYPISARQQAFFLKAPARG